jgi:PRTRC genetic system protein A
MTEPNTVGTEATLAGMLAQIRAQMHGTFTEVFDLFNKAQTRCDSISDAQRAAEQRAAEAEAKVHQLQTELNRQVQPAEPAESEFDRLTPAYPFAVSREAPPAVLDIALWQAAPALAVARHASFAFLPHDVSAHRYLIARDGLWLECRRPWLHLIWPIGKLNAAVALPYGTLTKRVAIAFGKVPHDMIREFAAHGQRNAEREIGTWATWVHGLPGEPHLAWADNVIFTGTAASLEYRRPAFTEHECPCLDFHTHGTLPAGFSSTDNEDDAHDVKIAIVLGNLDQPVPSIAARLCCLGLMLPIGVDAGEVFGVAG